MPRKFSELVGMFSCHQERKGEEIINRSNRPGRDVAADILPVLRIRVP